MARRTRPRGAQAVPTDKVVVRMYRVGFGDCFLIFVPDGTRTRKVLIDCGSIKRDPNLKKGAAQIAKQVIKDITEADGKQRIDLLVATHRHKDHIGGFADAAWEKVEVGEVWLPWTEADNDPSAVRIRRMQDLVATRLSARLSADGKPELSELAANAASNVNAMNRLKAGFEKRERIKPRFLGAGANDTRTVSTSHVPGVRVHVLGPPRDESVISRDLPRDEDELFIKLGAAVDADASPTVRPFGDEWIQEAPIWELDPRHVEKLKSSVDLDPESSLAAIDDSLNNTSLVLVFEIGGRLLLFPGDAQWGPWEAILQDEEWIAILRKVSFYKVSHHSSHNGTPRQFIADVVGMDLAEPLSAMVSVTEHGSYRDIPREPLMEALHHRFDHVAVSDVEGDQPGFTRATKWSIDFEFEPKSEPA